MQAPGENMSWIDRLLPFKRPRASSTAEGLSAGEYLYRAAPRPAPKAQDTAPLPRFQATAGDQLDPRAADRFALIRAKLRNAYTPAQPVSDRRMFAGRTKVMSTLIRSIEDQRVHVVIYGERGIGKTSLLQVLAKAAQEARYLVVYVTCGARSEFDETFRAIAANIPLMYHSSFGPTSPEAEKGETLGSLLGAEPITVRGASEALGKIEGTRVLVILDEYDRATSEDFRRSIAELLKSLSDQSARVQFLIAGVAANLTELVANVPSIQRNVFTMQIPKMTASEIRNIIKNGESLAELNFDDGAVHAIIARCIGFPYLATLISHRAALTAVDQNRLTITAEDVAAATTDTVNEFRDRISRRSQMQIDQQVRRGRLAALGALAGAAQSTGGWFTLDEITDVHADPTGIAQARTAAEQLAAEQILIESREDEFGRAYRFIEPSVPIYLWLLAARGQFFDLEQPERRGEPV